MAVRPPIVQGEPACSVLEWQFHSASVYANMSLRELSFSIFKPVSDS